MQPTVSVIVPVYNRKAWLQELIASLRAQTYPADRFEVIVVDNGSTDGAWEWIEAQDVAGAAPRIRAYRNDTPFRVPSGSRNVGLRYATGDIVAFTDSDCITQPGWLERGVACLSEGFGLVVGRTVAVPWDKVTSRSKTKVVEDEGLYDTCNIFYKREAIERVGGGFAIDVLNMGFPVYGEDSELGFRVKAAGYRSAFAGDAIVMHHVREQSFRQYFSEAKHLYSCPYLVKKHPETRRTLLYRRVFLSRQTALFDLAVAGLALGFASFLVSCACPVRYDRGGLRRRPTMFWVPIFTFPIWCGAFGRSPKT